jgi:exodeoxyribonuclease V alpha subunit
MNNTAAAADREPLAGLVERVTYHNPDNGYCVLRVKVRGHRDLVTVLGHAASISDSMSAELYPTYDTEGVTWKSGW